MEHWVSAFLSSHPPYCPHKARRNRSWGMVVVLHAALQKRDDLAQLGTLQDQLRLLLATQAAGCAAHDWELAYRTIRWDGATDILPLHLDSAKARSFLDGIPPERRRELQAVLESREPTSGFFLA